MTRVGNEKKGMRIEREELRYGRTGQECEETDGENAR